MVNKIIKLLFIIIASLFVIIPLFFTDFKGGEISETEKRKLALGPLQYKDNITDFKISQWINDNIGLRKEMIKYKTYIEYFILHKSPTSKVEIGKDGFLFYTAADNMKIPNGTYPLDDYTLRVIKKQLIMIQDIIGKYGIELAVVIAPSKVSIYPEYVRYHNYTRIDTPHDIVGKYISDKINFINLKDVLYIEKEKNDELLYFKTDTHWNPYGAYIAYQAILDNFKEKGILDKQEQYVAIKKDYNYSYKGELHLMAALTELDSEKSIGTNILNNKVIELEEYDYVKNTKEKFKKKYPDSFLMINSLSNPKKSKKILVNSDSMFSYRWNMPYYLASHFKEYQQVWGMSLDMDFIKEYQPDVLLIEKIEYILSRYPNYFSEFTEENFIEKAEISSENIPDVMKNGESYSFDIKIKNIGEYNIGYDYMSVLGIIETNNDTNKIQSDSRLKFEENIIIKPEETYILHINNFKPNFKGKTIEIKLGEENVRWFSNGIKINIINN